MARKLTEDFIGTCQVCLGEYKVNSQKTIVLHGYRRPGWGYTVGNCQGTANAPFEYDCTLTKKVITSMHDDVAKMNEKLAKIDGGKIIRVKNPNYISPDKKWRNSYGGTNIDDEYLTPEMKGFDQALKILRHDLAGTVTYVEKMIDYFQEVVDGWAPRQIVGIDTPATGRERYVRDAYDPDKAAQAQAHQAAKAERDAKPGKITINVYDEISFPSRSDTLSTEAWRAAIEKSHSEEEEFKARIKAWAKATFPGKLWVGSGDQYSIPQVPGHSPHYACIAFKPEWQYRDAIMAMFPEAHRYDKDTLRRDPVTKQGIGKGKDIRLWVRADQLP